MVLPALATLQRRGLLPQRWALLGTGRTPISSHDFDELLRDAVEEFGDDEAAEGVPELTQHTAYCGDVSEDDSADELPGELDRLREALGGDVTVIHYLAVPPSSFAPITRALKKAGLTDGVRVVYEKPYGTSLETFRELDATVHDAFDEEQVFRIDHFLGKEATQNLHVLRFANELFGGIWNRQHVAQVQIDVPETLDVAPARGVLRRDRCRARHAGHAPVPGGRRGRDGAAAPARRREPGRRPGRTVIAHFRPLDPANDVVLGQYDGYRDIDGVPDDSTTDTFVAARLWVDTERWKGVPFLLRTGKRMAVVGAAGDARAADARRAVRLPRRPEPRDRLPGRIGRAEGHDHRQATRRVPRAGHGDRGPGPGRRRARRVPAAVRRAAGGRARRRPHAVHHARRASSPRGSRSPRCSAPTARRPSRTRCGSWGPESAHRLAEPHGWVLGDRREAFVAPGVTSSSLH